MAKNNIPTTPLSFVELVMRADAETLRQALEARVKIDGLLAEREAAYRRIAELEGQVEEIVGTPGAFVFPPPPVPVSGFAKPAATAAPSAVRKEPAPTKAPAASSAAPKNGGDAE